MKISTNLVFLSAGLAHSSFAWVLPSSSHHSYSQELAALSQLFRNGKSNLQMSASSASTAEISPRLKLAGLNTDRFSHPLDRETQRQLKQFWPVEEVVRAAIDVVEETIYLDNLSTAIKVSPDQFGDIYDLALEACEILDIDGIASSSTPSSEATGKYGAAGAKKELPVDIYIRQNPTPNAYTLAASSRGGRQPANNADGDITFSIPLTPLKIKIASPSNDARNAGAAASQAPPPKPFIVLHTSLIDLLTPAELQAVIGHELGHIKCEHGVWISAANVLALAASVLVGENVVSGALSAQLASWQRAAEFTCDRAALLVAQDIDVVVSALLKLVGGTSTTTSSSATSSTAGAAGSAIVGSSGGDLNTSGSGGSGSSRANVEAFLRQAKEYKEAVKRAKRLPRNVQMGSVRERSHPLPVIRAAELQAWYEGAQYRGIVSRGKPL